METFRIGVEQKINKINKLFLIGNGFDLSLGLRTSYNDFLLWLLKKYIIEAIDSKIQIAPFDKYKGNYDSFMERYNQRRIVGYSSNLLFDVLLNPQYTFDINQVKEMDTIENLFAFIKTKKIEINTTSSPLLFKRILDVSSNHWVDIEGIYFETIKEIIKNHKTNEKRGYLDLIVQINQELSIVIDYLKSYLVEIDVDISKDNAQKYLNQFTKELKKDDFSFLHNKKETVETDLIYFLNFNYTNSLTQLLNHFKKSKYLQNHIHGNLNEETNQIIFGFGDEMDVVYKEIEELNDNRFFEHIKSFQYFKTPNYRQLLSFLNSGNYQVCIYGHSCGLSDRIMLNEIFEHENCKSIKIYHYTDNDFTTKTMEISRHFNSNQLMRKKIVDKSNDCLIPQIIK